MGESNQIKSILIDIPIWLVYITPKIPSTTTIISNYILSFSFSSSYTPYPKVFFSYGTGKLLVHSHHHRTLFFVLFYLEFSISILFPPLFFFRLDKKKI